MGNYIWNTSSTPNYMESNDNNDNIPRIYVDPNIKKTIILDELSINDNSSDIDYNKHKNTAGISYPVICINDHIIKSEEIDVLEISCDKFLPSINLQITPLTDNLIIKDPPKDGDIISIFIRTTTDVIVPLRCDFIINSNNINNSIKTGEQTYSKLNLNGVLFVPGINSKKQSYAFMGSSKNALKDIAKRLGLGFATNDKNDTNDKQLWICPKSDAEDYINDIIKHAWKDEQSFYKSWIDIYYNINYINVNEALISSDSDIDITAMSSVTDAQKLYPQDTSQNNATAIPKIFNNVIDNMKPTSFYVVSWTPINKSSHITKRVGSQILSNAFIHNQNMYNSGSEPYITLTNTQMYDPQKIDNHIILRGRTSYNSSTANDNDMSRQNIKTDDINTKSEWHGIQYTISDNDNTDDNNINWSGNVHLNYNRALSHNKINKKELDKMYIKIIVNGPCLQVMRGEKVPVLLRHTPGITTDQMMLENNNDINKMYSGMYFVDSYKIIFKHNKNSIGAGYSNFKTEFILKRREWPAPVQIEKDNN